AEEDFEKAKTAYFDLPAERMTQEEINAERAQLGEQLTTHDEHSRQLFAMNARITELSEAAETVKKMKGIQAELEKRKKDKASFDDQFQMATEQIRVIASVPAGERTAESKAKLDELSRHTDEIMAQIQTSGVEISRLQHQLDSLPPIPEGIDPERVKAEFFKAVKERDKYERQVSKTSDPQVTARIQALDEAQAILDARDEVERAYEEAMDARFEAEANRNRVLNRLERERELVRDFEAMRDSAEDKADGLDKRLSELSKKKKK
ncbi:MAG: hypothetical protein J6J23_00970, partial [Clostridia bacterium]|nr:hypothetical protein [Clostridia bacterium]